MNKKVITALLWYLWAIVLLIIYHDNDSIIPEVICSSIVGVCITVIYNCWGKD